MPARLQTRLRSLAGESVSHDVCAKLGKAMWVSSAARSGADGHDLCSPASLRLPMQQTPCILLHLHSLLCEVGQHISYLIANKYMMIAKLSSAAR